MDAVNTAIIFVTSLPYVPERSCDMILFANPRIRTFRYVILAGVGAVYVFGVACIKRNVMEFSITVIADKSITSHKFGCRDVCPGYK